MNAKGFFQFGPFRFDIQRNLLYRDKSPVAAAPKVLHTLGVLLRNYGQLVEKDDLIKAVWPNTFVEENNLSQNISAIRKILAEGGDESWIETVPRRGFRMVAPVRFVEEISDWPRRQWITAGVASLFGLTAVGAWLMSRRSRNEAAVRSVVVLPVLNLSGDSRQDFVADGITEGLIAELARIAPLRIISRTSAMSFKGTRKTMPEIARELGVDAAVEASVTPWNDKLKVQAKLIRASNEQHLWSAVYVKEFTELGGVQAQIAQAIAGRLGATLTVRPVGSVNHAAYEEYLRGQYEWNKRTPDGIDKGIVHFRNAIEIDPAFAPSYAGLADCYNQLGSVMIGSKSPRETRPLAAAAARKAIQINEQLAEAHAALAMAVVFDWNWRQAEHEYQRALELSPGLAPARSWYSIYLMSQDRMAAAVEQARSAVEFDPLSPPVRANLAWILDVAGQSEEAIREALRGLQITPGDLGTRWRLGMAYTGMGRYLEAIEALEQCVAMGHRSPIFLDSLGEAYAWAGQKGKAVDILKEIEAQAAQHYQSPIVGLFTCLALARWNRAFELLEQGLRERTNYVIFLRVLPLRKMYPNFRTHPRFQAMLRRIGA